MNSLTMLVGFLVHSCTLLHSLSGILNVNICDWICLIDFICLNKLKVQVQWLTADLHMQIWEECYFVCRIFSKSIELFSCLLLCQLDCKLCFKISNQFQIEFKDIRFYLFSFEKNLFFNICNLLLYKIMSDIFLIRLKV